MATAAKRGDSVVLFFLITFLVSWAFFVTVVMTRMPASSPLGTTLVLFGVFAPAAVSLALVAWREGREGVRALLARMVQGGVPARWYVFAIGYMAAVKLTVAIIHRIATGAWPRFGHDLYLMPIAVLFSTPSQAGEELGWRGYALPRMAARVGLGPASVVLGVIWALWHLPLFYVVGADTFGQSFVLYTLQVTALSVAIAWLYGNAGGSLLLTMLMHAAINNTKDIVPSATPGATGMWGLNASLVSWLTVAVLWACAIVFLMRMPRLERRDPGR